MDKKVLGEMASQILAIIL